MPKADEPNDKALESLDARLAAFEARRAADRPAPPAHGETGSADGYRLLADLIGGVLVGLGFGWLLDRYAHTSPFGLVGGVLIGMGASIFIVVRKATKMSAQASAKQADESQGAGEPGPEKERD
jgi:ATP synthase protein I